LRRYAVILLIAVVGVLGLVASTAEQVPRLRPIAWATALFSAALGFIFIALIKDGFFSSKPAPWWAWGLAAGIGTVAATSVPVGIWDAPIAGLIWGALVSVAWFSPKLRGISGDD
jgi:hypothetical protein